MANSVGEKVPFFTPVESDEKPFLPVLKVFDHYLNFGDEVAVHESSQAPVDGSRVCRKDVKKTNCIATALKIATYILSLGIFPLIALMVKAISRCVYQFHYAPENNGQNERRGELDNKTWNEDIDVSERADTPQEVIFGEDRRTTGQPDQEVVRRQVRRRLDFGQPQQEPTAQRLEWASPGLKADRAADKAFVRQALASNPATEPVVCPIVRQQVRRRLDFGQLPQEPTAQRLEWASPGLNPDRTFVQRAVALNPAPLTAGAFGNAAGLITALAAFPTTLTNLQLGPQGPSDSERRVEALPEPRTEDLPKLQPAPTVPPETTSTQSPSSGFNAERTRAYYKHFPLSSLESALQNPKVFEDGKWIDLNDESTQALKGLISEKAREYFQDYSPSELESVLNNRHKTVVDGVERDLSAESVQAIERLLAEKSEEIDSDGEALAPAPPAALAPLSNTTEVELCKADFAHYSLRVLERALQKRITVLRGGEEHLLSPASLEVIRGLIPEKAKKEFQEALSSTLATVVKNRCAIVTGGFVELGAESVAAIQELIAEREANAQSIEEFSESDEETDSDIDDLDWNLAFAPPAALRPASPAAIAPSPAKPASEQPIGSLSETAPSEITMKSFADFTLIESFADFTLIELESVIRHRKAYLGGQDVALSEEVVQAVKGLLPEKAKAHFKDSFFETVERAVKSRRVSSARPMLGDGIELNEDSIRAIRELLPEKAKAYYKNAPIEILQRAVNSGKDPLGQFIRPGLDLSDESIQAIRELIAEKSSVAAPIAPTGVEDSSSDEETETLATAPSKAASSKEFYQDKSLEELERALQSGEILVQDGNVANLSEGSIQAIKELISVKARAYYQNLDLSILETIERTGQVTFEFVSIIRERYSTFETISLSNESLQVIRQLIEEKQMAGAESQ